MFTAASVISEIARIKSGYDIDMMGTDTLDGMRDAATRKALAYRKLSMDVTAQISEGMAAGKNMNGGPLWELRVARDKIPTR